MNGLESQAYFFAVMSALSDARHALWLIVVGVWLTLALLLWVHRDRIAK